MIQGDPPAGVVDEFYKEFTMLVQDRLDGDVSAASNVLKVSVATVKSWMAGATTPHWQVRDAALRTLRSQGWN